jgi:hypothetical protein
MLITGPELIRVEPDGSRVRQADLSHISPLGWSEFTVDGRGNVYVNTPHLRALRMGDQTGPPLAAGAARWAPCPTAYASASHAANSSSSCSGATTRK